VKTCRQMALTIAGTLVMAAVAAPAAGQWQIDSKDGKTSVKLGFLAQPQLEVIGTTAGASPSTNISLRRFRFLFGGRISEEWTFFFETDSPNLGKANPDAIANPTGTKDAGTIFVQDAYLTYGHTDAFKIDGGLMLTPLGHNHGQSAASLLPIDYGPYTFTESAPTGERTGRDYGIQLRGYPLGQHLEYRLGVFQGVRGVRATNAARVAGRVVYYPFASDSGFFYGGTFHGARRVLGIGGSFDRQQDYAVYSADVFVEQPIRRGEQGITAQVNWMRFDGGTFLRSLPRQDTYLLEAGCYFKKGRVSPLVQYASRSFANPATPGQKYWQAGLAYWMSGHQRNLKVTAGQTFASGQPKRMQVLAQLQVLAY